MQSSFTDITLRYGCSTVNLLHIFRTPFLKNTSGELLLKVVLRLIDFIILSGHNISACTWTSKTSMNVLCTSQCNDVKWLVGWFVYFAQREAVVRMCSVKKVLLKFVGKHIAKFVGKHLYWGFFLIKLQAMVDVWLGSKYVSK